MQGEITTGPILVTGGTGTLGRHLVPRLRAAGQDVRVLSRTARPDREGVRFLAGDLTTGEGVAAAVEAVETIVHCAGTSSGDDVLTRNLVQAARPAGVRHLVYISVVGADRFPMASALDRAMFGYYGSKAASERIVAESGLPWTTLRATQFHDLILTVAQAFAKLPVIPLPAGARFQPIETDEVAARLVELAQAEPVGMAPEMGGPRVHHAAELMRSYLRAVGKRRPILPLWLPGRAAAAMRAGVNLTPDHAVGRRTWEDFLAERTAGAARTA